MVADDFPAAFLFFLWSHGALSLSLSQLDSGLAFVASTVLLLHHSCLSLLEVFCRNPSLLVEDLLFVDIF